MREPPLILVVDDVPDNVDILQMRLESQGYEVVTAGDGVEALEKSREVLPDLVLLDVMMPKMDGIETVKRLKADTSLPFIPVILVTAKSDTKDVVGGLESGGDDYLTKPVDHAALSARVRSMLRIKGSHDTVQDQARRIEEQAAELAIWNRRIEERVAAQLGELERVGRLKRFLAPQLAEMIVSTGDEGILESHRRDIVVVFCDLRGFTAFSETAEPEEVMAVLSEYHAARGPLVSRFEGTLDHFSSDGLMVFFNDPLPCPDGPRRNAGRRDRDSRPRPGTRGEKRDRDNPDRLHHRRSGRGRVRRQPRPAGRQPHGRQHPHRRADAQAARAAIRAGSAGQGDCPASQPEQSSD